MKNRRLIFLLLLAFSIALTGCANNNLAAPVPTGSEVTTAPATEAVTAPITSPAPEIPTTESTSTISLQPMKPTPAGAQQHPPIVIHLLSLEMGKKQQSTY